MGTATATAPPDPLADRPAQAVDWKEAKFNG